MRASPWKAIPYDDQLDQPSLIYHVQQIQVILCCVLRQAASRAAYSGLEGLFQRAKPLQLAPCSQRVLLHIQVQIAFLAFPCHTHIKHIVTTTCVLTAHCRMLAILMATFPNWSGNFVIFFCFYFHTQMSLFFTR